MKVEDLINNKEFSFNVKFIIAKYSPTPYDPDYINILYDSETSKELDYQLLNMNICAMNQNDDGTVVLEVY